MGHAHPSRVFLGFLTSFVGNQLEKNLLLLPLKCNQDLNEHHLAIMYFNRKCFNKIILFSGKMSHTAKYFSF